MKILIRMVMVVLLAMLAHCSYVIGTIEGKITNRATFSIDATYDENNQQLTVNWPDAILEVDNDAFAGYELYISKDMNNEYTDYQLVVARFDEGNNIADDANMGLVDTSTYTVNIVFGANGSLPQVNGASFQVPAEGGVLFLRIGIIYWDQETSDGRVENWNPYEFLGNHFYYNDTTTLVVNNAEQEWFYQNKSKLSLISGYARVTIPSQ